MEKIKFNKEKYVFSSKYKKVAKINDENLKKSITIFLKEIRAYSIKISRLCNIRPNENSKNLILNIAYYIAFDEELIKKLIAKKDLPYKILIKEIDVKEDFLEKWRHYIISYTILLYKKRYTGLVEYLNIEFKDTSKLRLVEALNNSEKDFVKGIVIKNHKKSPIILTRQGEFIKIKYNEENIIGEEKAGKEKKNLFKYRKRIIPAFIIIAISFMGIIYINNYAVRTVIISGTSTLKLETNIINRVRYQYSQTEKGSNVLLSIGVNNKKIDDVIVAALKEMQNEDMVLDDRLITIVVNGKKLDGDQLNTISTFMEYQNQMEDQNKKINVMINNAGTDRTLSEK